MLLHLLTSYSLCLSNKQELLRRLTALWLPGTHRGIPADCRDRLVAVPALVRSICLGCPTGPATLECSILPRLSSLAFHLHFLSVWTLVSHSSFRHFYDSIFPNGQRLRMNRRTKGQELHRAGLAPSPCLTSGMDWHILSQSSTCKASGIHFQCPKKAQY